MADDGLIAGAAAPAGTRLIRSVSTLDAVWASVVAMLLVGSSFFWLIDLPNNSLRTLDAPLRVYVIVAPVVAIAVAVTALIVRAEALAAIATGVLVPSIALAGSLAGSLFFDDASPFTDAGVPLTLGVATLGVVMLLRWFVYRPVVVAGVDPRPPTVAAQVLGAVGAVLVANVVVGAVVDDVAWSLSFVVATGFMLLGPIVVVVAAASRMVATNVLAATACLAQVVAVTVAALDDGGVTIGSTLALRTGAIGLAGSLVAAAVAVAGAIRAEIGPVDDVASAGDDDVTWRWTADDDG